MKTILMMRHAKSDWGTPSLSDFDRPLNQRGLKDAPRMGNVLAQYDMVPDQILASPAKRAKHTAELVAEASGYAFDIAWQDHFYDATSADLIKTLQALPNDIQCPLLVGHNPTMEDTVAELLTSDDDGSFIRVPTGAIACLDVDISDWRTLLPGYCSLRWFIIPRLVKAIA